MSPYIYYLICTLLTLAVLCGIWLMSRVQTARLGNQISAGSTLLAIVLTMVYHHILPLWMLYILLSFGGLLGFILARRVQMIQMPQLVALLNGIGGGASALVGLLGIQALALGRITNYMQFAHGGSMLAVFIGLITFSGSLVAAGKLHKILTQRPVVFPAHGLISGLTLIITLIPVVWAFSSPVISLSMVGLTIIGATLFGYLFAIRVGGADMPITISLLNSLSGLAGAIAGMATGDVLLIAIGGVVGASGLLLTQIMCRAMNRSLVAILLGKGISIPTTKAVSDEPSTLTPEQAITPRQEDALSNLLHTAREVIIVPGYGMALSQAQHEVRSLANKFTAQGARVRYAIHPVAGRMPGHMNVLLAEADVDYEDLYEMEAINQDFAEADLVVVIGANDVINPAARQAEGTPIYGMPVLNVDQAKQIIICNYDLSPGYAGVPNPIYTRTQGVHLRLGDAKKILNLLLESF